MILCHKAFEHPNTGRYKTIKQLNQLLKYLCIRECAPAWE